MSDDSNEVKYPDITVQLTGEDGNTFVIIARISQALKKAGTSSEIVKQFRDEAMSGDYDHVLQTAMRWVNIE
jgi:menaquinone-dependent protoporphyrinogen IX oxidase